MTLYQLLCSKNFCKGQITSLNLVSDCMLNWKNMFCIVHYNVHWQISLSLKHMALNKLVQVYTPLSFDTCYILSFVWRISN